MRGVDSLFTSDGSGAVIQLPAAAVITTGGSGNSTSSIAGLGGQANQVSSQQVVQFFAAEGGSPRTGTATVSLVDGAADTVYFSTALPSGTAAGDFIVIQGASGALNSSVQGIYAYQVAGNVGTTPTNLNRATYPGQLSTPNIALGNAAISPNVAYRAEILISRGLGLDSDAAADFEWVTSLDQQLAVNNLYQNVLIANANGSDGNKGDRGLDMTKRYLPNTFGGRDMKISVTAKQGRMDAICPETWGIIETVEPSLYEFGDGVTNMPVPTNDGTGTTTYNTSNIFFYNAILNLFQSNYKAAVSVTGAAVPATS
jgi:hypothetical protein